MVKLKKETALRNASVLSAYLIIVWGFYRMLFKLPENVEELVVKPILWLVPLFYFLRKEGVGFKSLGFTKKDLFPSIYFATILGVIFAVEGVLINFLKYGHIEFEANIGAEPFLDLVLLSLVTALIEETVIRGYLFQRIWHALDSEWVSNIISSLVWAVVHLPIAVFWWKFNSVSTVTFIFLMFVYGVGSSFVFARTKNIFSSILLHFLWGWPVILFR